MECLAARSSAAALAVSCHNWSPLRRRRAFGKQKQQNYRCRNRRRVDLQVVNSSGREESCTAVKEEFADEEDYIKAGGTQLLFVQMQARKQMEKQGKMADKVYISAP